MTASLELTGRFISLIDMNEEDWRLSSRAASVMLQLPDKRLLLIAGLTPDECRGLADAFGELVTVTVTQAAEAIANTIEAATPSTAEPAPDREAAHE